MTETELRRLYGWAKIDPDGPVVAGEIGAWRITYHAGRYGVNDGGVIKIAWRDVSDWQAPQFTDPQAPGYATVLTTGPVVLRPTFGNSAMCVPSVYALPLMSWMIRWRREIR